MWWSLHEPEPVLEALGEALVDHRPVQHLVERIADRRRRQPLGELGDELVVDRLVHDRGAQRRAALTGGAEAAEQGALDGQVDVGVVHHDHRVLAAELQARRLQVAPTQAADLATDRARAGETDLVEQTLLQRGLQAGEGVRARGLDDVQDATGHAAGVEELRQRVTERGAVLGRLVDDRVAAQDRRHQVPGGHRDGEVAGGDDRRHADRHPEREELLVRHLRRHGLAVQATAFAEEEVARVDDLLDLAERLRIGLADLARDQPRQRLLVGLDQPADLRDHAPAGRRRHGRPLLLRGTGGTRGVDERGRVAESNGRDDLGGVGGIGGGQRAAGGVRARFATDDGGDVERARGPGSGLGGDGGHGRAR